VATVVGVGFVEAVIVVMEIGAAGFAAGVSASEGFVPDCDLPHALAAATCPLLSIARAAGTYRHSANDDAGTVLACTYHSAVVSALGRLAEEGFGPPGETGHD
jgi:hypothetical protein